MSPSPKYRKGLFSGSTACVNAPSLATVLMEFRHGYFQGHQGLQRRSCLSLYVVAGFWFFYSFLFEL